MRIVQSRRPAPDTPLTTAWAVAARPLLTASGQKRTIDGFGSPPFERRLLSYNRADGECMMLFEVVEAGCPI